MFDNQINNNDIDGEILQLFYVPVEIANEKQIPENPKEHDYGKIIESFVEYGFKDPCAYDKTADMIVEGNGRITALMMMLQDNADIPRGIGLHKETQQWLIPVLFGVDSSSRNAAIRYSVDHNNITLLGGDFSPSDIQKMWQKDGYKKMLEALGDEQPLSFTLDDFVDFKSSQENTKSDSDKSDTVSDSSSDKKPKKNNDFGGKITLTFEESFEDELIGSLEMLADSYPYWHMKLERNENSDE